MISFGKRDIALKAQRRDVIGAWIFTVIWCGGTFPLFYLAAFRSFNAFGAAITGVLALFGVAMLWTTVRITLDYLKFGVVAFTPQRGAVHPGGQLIALVDFLDNPPAASEIEVELLCHHVTWSKPPRGGMAVSEETVWTARRNFPLRQTGLGANAAITFDIPADAKPTDLPGERPGESGWMRIHLEPGKPRYFHRWEVKVTARVPGLNLERRFKVAVEPAVETVAAANPALSSAAPAHAPSFKWNQKWVIPTVMLAIFGLFFTDFFSMGTTKNTAPSPVVPRPTAPQQQAPLPATTPWITATSAWTMPMPVFARYAGVAANGIRYTRANGQMHITFDEIVIEKNPAQTEVEYFDLRFDVIYDEDPGRTRYRGGYSGQAEDIRGRLTVGNPVLVLRNRTVVAATPEGIIENMRYHLSINVVAPDRKHVLEKSIEISSR